MRYDPGAKEVSIWRENTSYANGMALDGQGRLYVCQGGATENDRCVVRYEVDGCVTVLADDFEGKRLNIPNDIVIDPGLRVWFTDPFYEAAAGPWSNDRAHKELDHDSVYRLDPEPDGRYKINRVTFDTTRPNGLLFSLDYKTLYVAQSGREKTEKRQLRAYPVKDDYSLGTGEVLHDFGEHRGIDGMRLDSEGNIIATAGWDWAAQAQDLHLLALGRGAAYASRPVQTSNQLLLRRGRSVDALRHDNRGVPFRAQTDRRGRT